MTTTTDLQSELREKICEMLTREPFVTNLAHNDIAEALVSSAFAWMDFNGGIDDTCHAAKQLHKMVDEAGASKNLDYSPEKLRDYLKKAACV